MNFELRCNLQTRRNLELSGWSGELSARRIGRIGDIDRSRPVYG
jgi:hypothetical protein